MLALLATLGLLAGSAQAQDAGVVTTYDLGCTSSRIQMNVRVTPRADRGPRTLLYADGIRARTHCAGELDVEREAGVRDHLTRGCVEEGLDAALCETLADDIVAQMVRMSARAPIDAMELEQGPNEDRGRIRIHSEDLSEEQHRVRVRDGRFTSRQVRTTGAAESVLECNETVFSSARGLATDIGRVEVADTALWQCRDASGELDIDVRFRFMNRAEGQSVGE